VFHVKPILVTQQ